jgi:hypothetical protein
MEKSSQKHGKLSRLDTFPANGCPAYRSPPVYHSAMSYKSVQQHAELCKLPGAEGYDVILLPIILGSAGAFFKCLDRARKEMGIANARKGKLYSKLPLQSTRPCVPTAIPGKI